MRDATQSGLSLLLRGPRAARILARFGVDPRRYWLLMDLFAELSARGEMLDQLGQNGVALDVVVKLYVVLSGIFTVALVIAQPAVMSYLVAFSTFTAFLLFSVLISETGNSLVNPAEGLILAHQPIDGATYTAAKLSHLGRIVLYLTPGLNAAPAIGGLFLKDAGWTYPFLHMAIAMTIGLVAALLCCALYGWLLRFVPARRLKAAGQCASAVSFGAIMWMQELQKLLRRLNPAGLLPESRAARWGLAVAIAGIVLSAVVVGIRSLSADYLIRVHAMMRGGASAGSGGRRPLAGAIVHRYFGGQPGRAGFAFVSRMILRDWQFRRQFLPMLVPAVIGFGAFIAAGWPVDPFSAHFSLMHLLPHITGFILFSVCAFLRTGSDYKGAWIFLLAPAGAFPGFARGVHALFWIEIIVIPQAALLPLLIWRWGIGHAVLFFAYSVATASIYLALELRLIEAVPFSEQVDPSRGAMLLPVMIGGGLAMALVVGIQFLMFRRPAIVAVATAGLAIAAFFTTRASVAAFTASIRYHLGLVSAEAGDLYKEVS